MPHRGAEKLVLWEMGGPYRGHTRKDTELMPQSAIAAEQQLRGQSIAHVAQKALSAAGLDLEAQEHLLVRADELQVSFAATIERLSTPGDFAEEEVSSPYTYPSTFALASVTEQVETLRAIFPQFAGCDFSFAVQTLPYGAEGNFVIPRWQLLATTYHHAVGLVLEELQSAFGTSFSLLNKLIKPENLKQISRTAEAMHRIEAAQEDCGLLIMPGQFGMRHRGRSHRRAIAVMRKHEFPLGIFAVACLLLSHRKRLTRDLDLWACADGDVFRNVALNGPKGPGATAFFHIETGHRVDVQTHWHDHTNPFYGSVTAWVA